MQKKKKKKRLYSVTQLNLFIFKVSQLWLFMIDTHEEKKSDQTQAVAEIPPKTKVNLLNNVVWL